MVPARGDRVQPAVRGVVGQGRGGAVRLLTFEAASSVKLPGFVMVTPVRRFGEP